VTLTQPTRTGTEPATTPPEHRDRGPVARGSGPGDGSAPRPLRSLPWRRPSRSGVIVSAIAALTALLYTWSLTSVGYGNSYYAAAVKSAATSWKALYFGSIDPGSFITVDKPPAAFWLQGLSARVFGFSSWSMLLPEAAAGVASVLILHRLVRKWAGDGAAHLAALGFALTPVAVLMFRYNNPDALLTFLCLAAARALWSAIETGRTRTLLLSAVLLGFAFNTKMLQAFLVVPAFVLVYLVAGKPQLGRRLRQLASALVALLVSSSWWVAIVALWPASSRPYIGSTTNNSILSLVFGYNGLSRIFGNGGGGAAPGGGGGLNFGGTPGLLRLFNVSNGGQISWLLPIAGVGLIVGLWHTRSARRTDTHRAGWLLWGGWALVSAAVFSLSQGIFHEYYSVQLAPAVTALAGAGAVSLWRLGHTNRWLRWALPATVVVTAGWAVALLDRTPSYDAWLRPTILVGAALAAVGFWLGERLRHRMIVLVAAAVAAATVLAGPAAYAITTVQHPSTGATPSAGPSVSRGALGGPGAGGLAGPGGGGANAGAVTSTDTGLIAYLRAHRGNATYLVAAFGSHSSAPIIIATGEPVVTIGGFNGADPAPSLTQFEHLVASGQVRYVLISGGGAGYGGGPPGAASSSAISQWVVTNGKEVPASSYGGSGNGTLYDVSPNA
jgi:4-amino-4-deoxy-L-arabinose transferase-like glycosyltransferase